MDGLRIRSSIPAISLAALIAGVSAIPSPAHPASKVSYELRSGCDGREPTMVGSAASEELIGTNGDDVILGMGGDDRIEGRRGNDVICGSRGDDQLIGGLGNDRLFGGSGKFDMLDPGDGSDYVRGGTGYQNYFLASAGDDVYIGSVDSFDIIDHYPSPVGVTVDLSAGTITGFGSDDIDEIDVVSGTPFDDVMIGDEGINHFAGQAGNDRLSTGGGGVLAAGGPRYVTNGFNLADVVYGGAGDDTLIGSAGFDVASFFDAPAPMTIDLETGTASGEGNDTLIDIEGVMTSRQGDTVFGDDGPNAIAVSGRALLVDGRGGEDLLVATYAFAGGRLVGVVIDLAAGTLDASDNGVTELTSIENAWGTFGEADVLRGTHGANVMKGFGGNDRILGREGDDVLNGGRGRRDELDGGPGTDRCVKGERETSCEVP